MTTKCCSDEKSAFRNARKEFSYAANRLITLCMSSITPREELDNIVSFTDEELKMQEIAWEMLEAEFEELRQFSQDLSVCLREDEGE